MGIVYVLTNEAMPGLVKIGMTGSDNANTRVGQLFSVGVPLPFRVEYACYVDNHAEVEQALHLAFAPHRINPRREFFRIDPAQAIVILRLLKQPDATEEVSAPSAEVDSTSIAAEEQARARRPTLNFELLGIPSGATLESVSNPEIRLTVRGDRRVIADGEEMSFSAGSQKMLQLEYYVRPAFLWRYNGRLLSDMYDAMYGVQ